MTTPAWPACLEARPDRGGLAVLRLHGPQGAQVDICRQGAHVLWWRDASGREPLYLSPRASFAPGTAIRGGVPVVFPQFSGRGALPKHGLVRGLDWHLDGAVIEPDATRLAFVLEDSVATRALWPHAFRARVEIVLGAGSLEVALAVRNSGAGPFAFTAALHSYLAVGDLAEVRVHGLAHRCFEDAAGGGAWRTQSQDALAFDGELDRVYPEVHEAVVLEQPGRRLHITAEGFPDVVVWNPGPALADQLSDLGADQYPRFACLEAACVLKPIVLEPGQDWRGRQRLVSA